ncbi:MAG: T9SS type A sorting domain-containing protein [Bacteroidales bacterium]|jgi:hypothetical protein|nr:T9SS type A sorting domain-containing protein [Bacteroidales bacterium]
MKKFFLAVIVLCLAIPANAQTSNKLLMLSDKIMPYGGQSNENKQFVQNEQVVKNGQTVTLFNETFGEGVNNGKWDLNNSTTNNILYVTSASPSGKTMPDTALLFGYYPAGGLSTRPDYANPVLRLVSSWMKFNGAENNWAYFDWLYTATSSPNSTISLGIAMRTSPEAEWTPVIEKTGTAIITNTPESSSSKIPEEIASADSVQLCIFLKHSTVTSVQFIFYFDNIKIVSFGGQTNGPEATLAVKTPGVITGDATDFRTTATVTNTSDIPITSLTIASKLNNGNAQYQQIAVNPATAVLSSSEIYVRMLGLTNNDIGINNFVYWISQINDSSFEPETVGKTECSVYVPDQNDAVYPIKYLVEHFTSSTCGPCTQNNITMNPFYDEQEKADKLIYIKYQMNWPGTGDPYYVAADGGVRRDYYEVDAVPTMFGNAVEKGSKAQMTTDINKLADKKAYIGITFNSANTDSVSAAEKNIQINYSITSKLTTEATVHTVVLENVTYNNKRTNGETEFHHVVMKMFPDGKGNTMFLKKDSTYNFAYTYNMATTHMEELSDLKLVVFVQNDATKEIYGNGQIDFTTLPSSANEGQLNAISIKVYPNPATDEITVESPSNSTLLLYNSIGTVVYKSVTPGNKKLSVASMPSGIYTLKVVSDKGIATQKIIKK